MKWKGYKERTWEAEENMEGAGRALELFWDRKEKEDKVKREALVNYITPLFSKKKNNKKKDVLWTSSDFGDFGDFLRVHLLSIG